MPLPSDQKPSRSVTVCLVYAPLALPTGHDDAAPYRQSSRAVSDELTKGIDPLFTPEAYEELIVPTDEHQQEGEAREEAIEFLDIEKWNVDFEVKPDDGTEIENQSAETTLAFQKIISVQVFRQEQLIDESLRVSLSRGE